MKEEKIKEKKNLKDFKLILRYLKQDKLLVTLYLILVLFTIIPEACGPILWGIALESLVAKNLTKFILILSLYEIFWMLGASILQAPREKIYNKLEIKFTKSITKDLYTKIDSLPAIAFERIGVGEFINRLSSDTDRIMTLLSKLIKLFLRSVVAIFAVILAFNISYIVGIEVLLFAVVMGITANYYYPKIKKVQKEIKKESDKYVKVATENITGIREIKSLGIKGNIEKMMFASIDTLFNHSRENAKNEINYYAINNLLYFFLQFVIIVTCGYFFIQGNIVYSVFIMMETYLWRIDMVVESLSDFGVNFNKVSVSLSRINDLLENRLYQDEQFGDKKLVNTKGIIKFNNVKFRYSEEEDYTLKGLSMEIKPYKKIAIVGKSGNGKSTIFNLLLRYFDSTKGNITIDGIDIKDLTEESLRKNVSIIRQSPFLFNMSIIDNFRLVKPKATLKEIRMVCKEAYIDDYIMNLKDKYKTIIGEGGVNLSGGQKQRLAIARTLLLNTKIILFDEATSALDNESQEYIKKTIDDLVKNHTIIIVAHRLSTIVDADEINIIEKGKLKAKGTHKELLKQCDTYQKLYSNEDSNSKKEA